MTRAGVGGAAAAKIPLIAKPGRTLEAFRARWRGRGAFSAERRNVAGFESGAAPGRLRVDAAPSIYALLRLLFALAVPGALFAWGPHDTSTMLLLSGAIGIALGIVGPPAMLTRLGRLRQEKDSPIDSRLARLAARLRRSRRQSRRGDLRVGREMLALHPELSYEFLMMNRRMNAGMRREDALHGSVR